MTALKATKPAAHTPVGLRQPWKWVQPSRDELLPRLRDAFELNVPARERENLCSVAYSEIISLRSTQAELVAALEIAFDHSCARAESRAKWTIADQNTHETIGAALAKATP